MRATLTRSWPVFTRPAYSSMRFGLVPTAATTVGVSITLGISVCPPTRPRAAPPGPEIRRSWTGRQGASVRPYHPHPQSSPVTIVTTPAARTAGQPQLRPRRPSLIDTIKGGTLLLAYYPDAQWLQNRPSWVRAIPAPRVEPPTSPPLGDNSQTARSRSAARASVASCFAKQK